MVNVQSLAEEDRHGSLLRTRRSTDLYGTRLPEGTSASSLTPGVFEAVALALGTVADDRDRRPTAIELGTQEDRRHQSNTVRVSLFPGPPWVDFVDLAPPQCKPYPCTGEGLRPASGHVSLNGEAVPARELLKRILTVDRVKREADATGNKFGVGGYGELGFGYGIPGFGERQPYGRHLYREMATDRWFVEVVWGESATEPRHYFQLVRDEALAWLEANGYPNPYSCKPEPPGPNRARRPGGRPRDTNIQEDRRISQAWATKSYATHLDLARALGKTLPEVKRALDRVRHRSKPPRRKKSGQGD